MRHAALVAIALLSAGTALAQSAASVRHHQAMEDSVTGERLGEMTIIVRDQVVRNGAVDVLVSANGADWLYSHRTLAPAQIIDRYMLTESGEALEIERSLVLPDEDVKGTATLRFGGSQIATFLLPLDGTSRMSLRRVLDDRLPRSFQFAITRAIGSTPFELAASMMSRASQHPPPWRLSTQAITPDCTFDSRFGWPCSPDQEEVVNDAAREHRLLESY